MKVRIYALADDEGQCKTTVVASTIREALDVFEERNKFPASRVVQISDEDNEVLLAKSITGSTN
jgi:hypothetical protein